MCRQHPSKKKTKNPDTCWGMRQTSHSDVCLIYVDLCTFCYTHAQTHTTHRASMQTHACAKSTLAPAMSHLTSDVCIHPRCCPHKNFSASCLRDFHYVLHYKASQAGATAHSAPFRPASTLNWQLEARLVFCFFFGCFA